jgi:hypothetical protein
MLPVDDRFGSYPADRLRGSNDRIGLLRTFLIWLMPLGVNFRLRLSDLRAGQLVFYHESRLLRVPWRKAK